MPESYDIDQTVRMWAAFTVGEVPTDPTTVTLKVEDPSGNEETFTYAAVQVIRASTGSYYYDYLIDEYGDWTFKYIGTGACSAADEATFSVDETVF